MKIKWYKLLGVPKTALGIVIVIVGVLTKNITIIKIGLSILGIGISAKLCRSSLKGRDPWEHEKALLNIFKKE